MSRNKRSDSILEANTKCEKLLTELTRLLENGSYQPHQRFFSVGILKEKYQVSQATVTETLKRLEQEGLIYSRPKSGTYVSPPQKVWQVLLIARSSRAENEELNAFLGRAEQDGIANYNFNINCIHEKDFLRDFKDLELIYRGVRGVIFFRTQDAFAAVREELTARQIVPVFYGSSLHRPRLGDENCYYYNEKTIVDAIMSRLYGAGHRRIGCVSFGDGVFAFRRQLYLDWMIEHRLPVEPGMLVSCSETDRTIYAQLCRQLKEKLNFTALFATHYGNGIEAIQALREHRLTIPGDVAILGIGSSGACRFLHPQPSALIIDHRGDAIKLIDQMAAAIHDPAAGISGESNFDILEGETL